MIMKANKQIGFIYKDNESIDKILKDGDVVFERGFLREKTSTTLPITFGGVGKDLKDYKIYGNTKQQILPDGYTQVDYIESSGTQYIDTGINADYKLSLDIKLTDILNTQKHMGAIRNNGNGVYIRHHFQTKNSNIQGSIVYYVDTSYYNIKNTSEQTNPHIYDIDVYNNTIHYDNDEPITITRTDFDTQLNYWLFWRNRNEGLGQQDKGNFRIYYCKMYVENILVPDFIPCYRNSDNEVGLYDLVNNVFYTNQGTGSFTYGSIAPTPDTPIEMVSCGDRTKNLCGELEQGGYDVNTGEKNTNTTLYRNKEPIKVLPNTNYIFSINGVGQAVNVLEYKADGTYIAYIGRIGSGAVSSNSYFTTSSETGYINIFRGASAGIEKWQIEQNDTISSYEPYGYKIPVNVNNSITNIYLDEPLRKIDGYSDYIDFINGKVVRNISETVLDGSEEWTYSMSNVVFYSNSLIGKTANSFYYASHFYYTDLPYSQWINGNCGSSGAATRCLLKNTAYTTVADFKTWLQSNNVVVDYILETPAEESITLPNIPTIDGNNTLNIETEITPSQVYIKYKSNE